MEMAFAACAALAEKTPNAISAAFKASFIGFLPAYFLFQKRNWKVGSYHKILPARSGHIFKKSNL
ncbi:hypothetical protein IB61_08650 [Brucella abortus LMN2]|nr:hypothetical protein IB61_08650 [Brucella abortus LMN2]